MAAALNSRIIKDPGLIHGQSLVVTQIESAREGKTLFRYKETRNWAEKPAPAFSYAGASRRFLMAIDEPRKLANKLS